MPVNVRAEAVKILVKVLHQGQSLSTCMDKKETNLSPQEGATLQAIVYGVLRDYFSLIERLAPFLTRPLKAKDQDIYLLLLIGIYQLIHFRANPALLINETVSAIKKGPKAWATGLVNAVLRSFIRAGNLSQSVLTESAKMGHPAWLIERIQQDWPRKAETIMLANQSHPPLFLRVNLNKISREAYVQHLAEISLSAKVVNTVPTAIQLDTPCSVDKLPFFKEGYVSVQDLSSQRVAEYLDCFEGARVLDACAAPGGKTGHLLERYPGINLTAVDKDVVRLARVEDNLKRLGVRAELKACDALALGRDYPDSSFDRILCDAPCSALGVIRRHPDIKFLRQPGDIEALARQQLALLRALWPLLRPEGQLLYTTCSILKAENIGVIQHFLGEQAEATLIPLALDGHENTPWGTQMLPSPAGGDGFFYALLKKR